ncbi:MAG TPA: Tm-1-like ATP-binding domain-containing protein [Candidatus Limnocylindria bacterium]|nr:Tm-1-like ATP-binding domain-containing protein [Candidatus Limnocylindria bacterium]
MATIAVLGTFDTKGEEHAFVAELIRRRGHRTLTIDTGALDAPRFTPDIAREQVAATVGADLASVVARKDRGETVALMARAATAMLAKLHREGRLDGVISLGGGGGTSISTAAMQALPLGVPKLMVSTLASGNVAPYVGVKDIVMMPSIVDVSGINRISRQILTRAAGAICGMVESVPEAAADKPIIVASMFGNTTQCVERSRKLLEAAGYEVLVFHATGTGGRTMESLIESGMVSGVLDITTTEWADEYVGGVLGAGPTRCEAAAHNRVPAIITPGCLDMVNFQERSSIPEKFADRRFYPHNPKVTLMRTTPEENAELGRILASKCNLSTAPITVLLPLGGISVISSPGQPFHDPAADQALFASWKKHLRTDIPVIEYPGNINDPAFADLCAAELLKNMGKSANG